MDFREFIQKWSASSSAERANAQPFLTDLCDVLGVERPRPTTGDPQLDLFVFEHDALISHEGGKVSVRLPAGRGIAEPSGAPTVLRTSGPVMSSRRSQWTQD